MPGSASPARPWPESRLYASLRALAQAVRAGVAGDGEQPAAQARRLQHVWVAPQAQQHLLGDVLGLGAVALDGRMIDKPVADRARLLLARAGRWV